MNRDEIQKLLGGYATGTLTAPERKLLFDAALTDQKLFDALADEEALRQLLLDPAAKADLLRALGPAPRQAAWRFWLGRPVGWAAAGSLAAAVALVLLMVRPDAQHSEPHLAAVREDIRSSEPRLAPAQPPQQDSAGSIATPVPRISERPERRAASVPPPAAPVRARESAADMEASPLPKREAPVPTVLNVPPASPMSAANAFQQTAPQLSADAAETRAEKARSGIGFTAMRRTAAAAPNATGVSGVRYEIQQRSESGMYQRVDPDLPLLASAPLRLQVETNKAGYLYAFETSPDESYRQLSIGPTVDPHVKHTVELGEPASSRKLLLVFSVRPQAAFTIGAATEGAARELDRLRQETASHNTLRQKSENSVYILDPAGSPVLLIEIGLPAAH